MDSRLCSKASEGHLEEYGSHFSMYLSVDHIVIYEQSRVGFILAGRSLIKTRKSTGPETLP